MPVPVPPAPVPGPRTSAAPCVGAAPWFGVSVTAIGFGLCGSTRGLGATTGVALLRMLAGEPPSSSFGFCCSRCCGGGGGCGGGGVSLMSNTCIASCGTPRSIVPDRWSNAKIRPAWIAPTARAAPPLSFELRFDRYISSNERSPRYRGCGCVSKQSAERLHARRLGWVRIVRSSGWRSQACVRLRDSPCRLCLRFPVVLPDPSLQIRASSRRYWLWPLLFSPVLGRTCNARIPRLFTILMKVRKQP